jgi:hypothetical protein
VTADISCDAFSLLAGRVNSVTIKGEGWRSPLDLTAQLLEVRRLHACVTIRVVQLAAARRTSRGWTAVGGERRRPA